MTVVDCPKKLVNTGYDWLPEKLLICM